MKLDIDQAEANLLVRAVQMAQKSAKRAQAGKSPQIQTIYRQEEQTLSDLETKISKLR